MIYRVVTLLAVISAASATAAELYVSPTGDDANSGTREKPLATLAGARDALRKLNYWHQILGSTGYGGMTIYLDDQHCGREVVRCR
jgi:triacylglycerol esterase/lipase EstA (alpha/beta hydrolase family)